MRSTTSMLVFLLFPLAFATTVFPSLSGLHSVTTLFNAIDVPLNQSGLPPPDPFSKTYEDLIIVLSKYGQPIPIHFFAGMYVRCLWDIWEVVAHRRNPYQPPEMRPLDGPSFTLQNEFFHLDLRQSPSAVVDWKYVDLYTTLNIIVSFAFKYDMREMDIEVVVAGVVAFGGFIRYIGPPET